MKVAIVPLLVVLVMSICNRSPSRYWSPALQHDCRDDQHSYQHHPQFAFLNYSQLPQQPTIIKTYLPGCLFTSLIAFAKSMISIPSPHPSSNTFTGRSRGNCSSTCSSTFFLRATHSTFSLCCLRWLTRSNFRPHFTFPPSFQTALSSSLVTVAGGCCSAINKLQGITATGLQCANNFVPTFKSPYLISCLFWVYLWQ